MHITKAVYMAACTLQSPAASPGKGTPGSLVHIQLQADTDGLQLHLSLSLLGMGYNRCLGMLQLSYILSCMLQAPADEDHCS